MPPLPIAPLDPSRVEEAVVLWRAADLVRPWNDPREDLHRALSGPSSTVLAAVSDDRLIATAMVGHDGHRGWVYYLAVDPAERSGGHGRAMMAACEGWLRERSIPKLELMIRSGNAAVAGFYAALGYDTEDVIVMSRRLDGATVGGPVRA